MFKISNLKRFITVLALITESLQTIPSLTIQHNIKEFSIQHQALRIVDLLQIIKGEKQCLLLTSQCSSSRLFFLNRPLLELIYTCIKHNLTVLSVIFLN